MKRGCGFLVSLLLFAGWSAEASEVVLKAAKDNSGRSSLRNNNNGRAATLTIANAPIIRAIVAFDLSSITNEIVAAEFRFRQNESNRNPLSLVVAPMAQTTNNASWVEGGGNLGAIGQYARIGESCYAFRSFMSGRWESASGGSVTDLGDPQLWGRPIATLNGQSWTANNWIRIPIVPVDLVENIRKSNCKIVTFGIWGVAGDGYYFISSNNSQWPPELRLTLKEDAPK
jgi:hypothetical protein